MELRVHCSVSIDEIRQAIKSKDLNITCFSCHHANICLRGASFSNYCRRSPSSSSLTAPSTTAPRCWCMIGSGTGMRQFEHPKCLGRNSQAVTCPTNQDVSKLRELVAVSSRQRTSSVRLRVFCSDWPNKEWYVVLASPRRLNDTTDLKQSQLQLRKQTDSFIIISGWSIFNCCSDYLLLTTGCISIDDRKQSRELQRKIVCSMQCTKVSVIYGPKAIQFPYQATLLFSRF